MRTVTDVFCLLGSNLGDREDSLRRACLGLCRGVEVEVLRASRIYETPPWGKADQPPFLNAAVQIKTTLDPEALLRRFQAVEEELGRDRTQEERWGPRPVDLDLLLYGGRIVETHALTLPHPHLHERAFALAPLLEIAPDLRDPRTGLPYATALERLGPQVARSCRGGAPLLLRAPSGPGLYLSQSPEETQALAAAMAREMRGGEVIALVGPLGAGKTAFAAGFGRGLGIPVPITSPSYVLIKSYEGGRLALHHADFYRLATAASPAGSSSAPSPPSSPTPSLPPVPVPLDAAGLGLEDYLGDSGAVVLIEWADQFPEWLEAPFWLVEIALNGPKTRLLYLRRIGDAREPV